MSDTKDRYHTIFRCVIQEAAACYFLHPQQYRNASNSEFKRAVPVTIPVYVPGAAP